MNARRFDGSVQGGGLLAIALVASSLGVVGDANAQVQGTVDNCVQATAILAGEEASFQAVIDHVKKENLRKEKLQRWEVVSEAERSVVKRIALKRYSVIKPKQGGPTSVLVAQCGHGGTCNTVAQDVLKTFPKMAPVPTVHCGDVSNVLENPSPAG